MERRVLRGLLRVAQRAVQPSVVRGLYPRRAGFHEVLCIEVGTVGVGRSGRMHNRQLTLLPQRLERRQRRMQPKESIKIEHSLARNVDARPHGVILRLGMRNHDVQTVGRAALEDHNQPLVARTRLSRTPCGASKKTWHRRGADDSESAVTKKDATSNGHKVSVET